MWVQVWTFMRAAGTAGTGATCQFWPRAVSSNHVTTAPLCVGTHASAAQQQERYVQEISPAASIAAGRFSEQSLVIIDLEGGSGWAADRLSPTGDQW